MWNFPWRWSSPGSMKVYLPPVAQHFQIRGPWCRRCYHLCVSRGPIFSSSIWWILSKGGGPNGSTSRTKNHKRPKNVDWLPLTRQNRSRGWSPGTNSWVKLKSKNRSRYDPDFITAIHSEKWAKRCATHRILFSPSDPAATSQSFYMWNYSGLKDESRICNEDRPDEVF
jgi:hypothetical protein